MDTLDKMSHGKKTPKAVRTEALKFNYSILVNYTAISEFLLLLFFM